MSVSVHWDSIYTLYTVYIHNRFFCLEVHDMASLDLIALYTWKVLELWVFIMILKIHCLKAVNPTEHIKEVLSKKVTAALINSQVQNEAALINS